MTRKWLWTLGILVLGAAVSGKQRWLGPSERGLSTDGVVIEFPLPNPGSGPTTIALTQDGTVWFTESAGNRIGRMRPDGTGLVEFPTQPQQLAAHHRPRGGTAISGFRSTPATGWGG